MEKLLINGGNRLVGTTRVGGAKNAAVGILPAALLADSPCIINNVPYIDDVITLTKILESIGTKISFMGSGSLSVNGTGHIDYRAVSDMVKRMRGSIYLLGALLARNGKVETAYPGGCEIGARPIDQHIKGFEALGAKVTISHGVIRAEADRLVGDEIYLDVVSIGATINIMLAAVKAEGTTVIANAAKEPHVVDVANFLNAMGANVKGAGTDTIRIKGVESLSGCEYTIIPDQIEAGTFMIAAAATCGDVTIKDVIPKHLESITAKLIEMGVEVIEMEDSVRVRGTCRPKKVNLKTLPYPGFPTDLQQPMTALLSTGEGMSIITEGIFEFRYRHVDELRRMGANIKVEDRVAIIQGVEKLTGASLKATDLRAGVALVIAGLMAEGQTEIEDLHHIDRGYENLEEKLAALGADIKRVGKGETILKKVDKDAAI